MPIRPYRFEPEWRVAVLALCLGASGWLVVSLVPWPSRAALLALLLLVAAIEFGRIVAAGHAPQALWLSSDGCLRVDGAHGQLTARWLPASVFGRQWALLSWVEPGSGSRRRRALFRRADNEALWPLARMIWRWAPRRDPDHIGVDLREFLSNFPRYRRSMVVTASGPETSKGARPHGLDIR